MSPSLNSTNLELVGHFEKNNNKKGGKVMSPLSVTYGKYAHRIPDVVAYEFYECFSSQ